MKQIYLLKILLFFTCITNAQVKIQGVTRYDIKPETIANIQLNTSQANATNFEDILYWIGSGSNEAALVIQWNDGKNADALKWGFRWDGRATGEDMVKAIAKADPRFFVLQYEGTEHGTAFGGFGFDLDGKGTNGLIKDNNAIYPLYPVDGFVNTNAYNFDAFKAIDSNDHWQSGWLTEGYWSYYSKEANTAFGYESSGATNRILKNGSWDVWNFNASFIPFDIASTFNPVSAYVEITDFTNGYFIVNEDWFGHSNGSLNFVQNDGTIHYRVYNAVNNNETFGTTTTGGVIYGDNIYFISKQSAPSENNEDSSAGRLVVADAKTLIKLASFNTIGDGDGRFFIGVNEHEGYIGTSKAIYLFDIDNLLVGTLVTGTDGSGQIGNMIRTSQHVYAVKQNKGILVIDPITHTVINTISGKFHSVVQAKDGSVWAIQDQKLININTSTFTITEHAIPTTKYLGSWGAWNAGSFTYSNQENALYWMNSINAFNSGEKIIKFDVASNTFNEDFATIPGQTETYKQIPYGAGLRIDPVSDAIIVNTTESGWGAHYQKNWIHTFNNSGVLTDTKILNDYYWFPTLTVFPDNTAPVIDSTLVSELTISSEMIIDLKPVISDMDNLSVAIVKSVKSNSATNVVSAVINSNDELVLTPGTMGEATIVISFNSNGKLVEKSMIVTVTSALGTDSFTKLELTMYPNPVSNILNIKTQAKILSASIYDALGRIIKTKVNNYQVDVSDLSKGLYIINLETEKANYQQTFIKK